MALILPRSYHKIAAIERNRISWIEPKQAERQDIRPLRIGILNIMPLGKQYEFNLLHPLGLSVLQIEPIWIRLASHAYKSWDQNHLNQLYVTWEEALAQGPLPNTPLACWECSSASKEDELAFSFNSRTRTYLKEEEEF